MDISEDFYLKFKAAYGQGQLAEAAGLVMELFYATYPEEMKTTPIEKDTVDMYLSVLAEEKMPLKNVAELNLFLLEPLREKLFGIEEDDDDWSF